MTGSHAVIAALAAAPVHELPRHVVDECLSSRDDRAVAAEEQFRQAFDHGLASVPRAERATGLNGVTGHIAESVAEVLLAEAGWTPLEHFTGPFSGGHGIDLAVLAPDLEHVVAVEVKGTLAPRRWPRLRGGDIPQLSREWLAKPGNPGVESLGLQSDGLGVLAMLVHFGRREWRAAASVDHENAIAVTSLDELAQQLFS